MSYINRIIYQCQCCNHMNCYLKEIKTFGLYSSFYIFDFEPCHFVLYKRKPYKFITIKIQNCILYKKSSYFNIHRNKIEYI